MQFDPPPSLAPLVPPPTAAGTTKWLKWVVLLVILLGVIGGVVYAFVSVHNTDSAAADDLVPGCEAGTGCDQDHECGADDCGNPNGCGTCPQGRLCSKGRCLLVPEIPAYEAAAGPNRTLWFNNQTDQTVWIGLIGNSPSQGNLADLNNAATGFQLLAGQLQSVVVPNDLSGRTWARTNCRLVQLPGGGKPADGTPEVLTEPCSDTTGINCGLVCDSGNCGPPGTLSGDQECGVRGGEAPATLAEFTFGGATGNDFYDISNVDGHSVGLGMFPVPDHFTSAAGVTGNFNCGNPYCQIFDDPANWCPPELQQVGSDGLITCLSICKAVDRADHIASVDNVTKYTVTTATGPQQLTAREWLQYLRTAQDWLHGRGTMKSLLCCDCGEGGQGCEQQDATGALVCPDTPCSHGCSDFVSNYPPCYAERVCPALRNADGSLKDSPDWPLATTGQHYADLYKIKCPLAYSWQFNDSSSTYQCQQADYQFVVF